jgi:hypothetical protein
MNLKGSRYLRPSLVATLACAALAMPRAALADVVADCSYFEISATSGATPAIDPELQPLERKLKRPPFSSWNKFHKLAAGAVHLVQHKAEALHLAQGAATLLLRDRHDARIEWTISVDGADGKRVIDTKQNVNAGDWNVVGHNVKDDGHILALMCR